MAAFPKALAPIMAVIFLGYLLRRTNFLPEETWPGMEKLTYFVLFPALLIHTLGRQSLIGTPWPSMLTVITGTLLTSALTLGAIHKIRPIDRATFTSIFQGGVRFNTYITLAVAQSYFGATGMAMGSITTGFMIVLINLLCVSMFVVCGNASFQGVLPFIRAVVGNPLIIGCTIGWCISLSGIGLAYLSDILEIVSRAALPFGLLAVGAALKPGVIRGHLNAIIISSTAQFCLKPLVTALLVYCTGLTGVTAGVLIIAFMTPTAPSAYILARQLGGDTATMASIITFQTLLAFIFMPFIGLILL